MPDSDTAVLSASEAPLAGPRVEKAARWIAVLAAVWVALAGAWEIAGPMCAGHFAVTAARGVAADNMLSWGIIGPVREYTLAAPSQTLVYAHHPWGVFWAVTAAVKLLGRHAYAIRLVPIVMASASALLLYGIGRALYGAVAGALCALGYAAVPLVLAYASFPGFELPTLFGCLVATWGYVNMIRTWQRRWVVVSVLGLLWACQADWIGIVFAGTVLVCVFAGHLLAPARWFGTVDKRRLVQWLAWGSVVCAGTVGFYAWYFRHIGALDGLFEAAQGRASSRRSWAQLLEMRSYWIDLMFTPLAVTLGKIAAALPAVRLLASGKLLEVFPLALLTTALVHYFLFPNGVSVHVYWPMPFAISFALGLAAFARSSADAVGWVLARYHGFRAKRIIARAALLAPGLVPALMFPDAVRALKWAHGTGGRFNDDGHLNLQDRDKAAALAWMTSRMQPNTRVRLHVSMKPDWSQSWTLHRPTRSTMLLPTADDDEIERYFVGDSRFMSARGQRTVASAGRLFAVGPFWLVDIATPAGLLQGFSFVEREPSGLERYLFQGNDPMRTVQPDPYWTWELRAHFGQVPNPSPDAPPVGREQLRIAHNIAVANGRPRLAQMLRARLLTPIDRTTAMKYDDGTELLGTLYVPSVAPQLVVYFLSAGPSAADQTFAIRSRVMAPEPWSLVPADPTVKSIGLNVPLSTKFWKAGFIYASTSEIRKRPGREHFFGYWINDDGFEAPRLPVAGTRRGALLVLP
ncbi:MAG: glycosyltransferase family 39 protein [Polyangiaceae bacterium]|nr:glycosyltransferase family 39 protein [Polyangiaceae bacterium]